MIKRIDELAIKAGGIWQGGYVEQPNGDSVYTEHKFVHGGDMDVEQFARLLVQEVCQIMKVEGEQFSLDQNFDAVKGVGRCMRRVKEHFGVEEC